MPESSTKQPVRTTSDTLVRNEHGLSTVEYIIILGLIAVACLAGWTLFGERLEREVGEADKSIEVVVD